MATPTLGCPSQPSGLVDGVFDLGDADGVLVGEADGDEAGQSVCAAGDTDGDGISDLLIGAPGEDSGGEDAGAAYVVRGPVEGSLNLALADAKLLGEEENDAAGFSVAIVGDLDGDGFDDLLIGAHDAKTLSGGVRAGVAYVVRGPASGVSDLADADARLEGEHEGDRTGWAVADAGDVDGDGSTDLIIGAPGVGGDADSSAGAAYLVRGPVEGTQSLADDTTVLSGVWAEAGISVAGAGDLDGDGYDDLLVGGSGGWDGYRDEPSEGCRAVLVRGPVELSLDLHDADAIFSLGNYSWLETSTCTVSPAGVLEPGTSAAVLIGADHGRSDGHPYGTVYAFTGPTGTSHALGDAQITLVTHDPEAEFSYSNTKLGAAIAAGDVDGDGDADVLSGGLDGNAYLWLGPDEGRSNTRDAVVLQGEPLDDWAWKPQAVAMGDLDGDGRADVVLGERFRDGDTGVVFVVSGSRLTDGPADP